MKRVVVTGLGIICPIGNNADEVMAALRDTRSGISFSPDFAENGFRSQVWGAPSLDPSGLIDRRAARFLHRGSAWNHLAMEQAIEDAGLKPDDISNERTGIIMGSGGPSTRIIVDSAEITRKNKSPKRIGPFAVPKAMSSTASATLATWFKIQGVNYTISSACSTSAHCIGNAYELIRWGKQERIFAGGHEDLDWTMSNLFDAMGAMSSKFNACPSSASRAYDINRDGFVISGGAGVLVLEELEKAKSRGAKIHAEITGYGATSDGYDMVSPSGEGAIRCMRQALSEITEEVDYINTHGTSTPVGDSREMAAIREVFGKKIPFISSTKSLTGHSLGAAGVHEAIYSILMMQGRFMTESAHIEEPDPKFEGMPILRKRLDNARIDTVLSNSFGFGGTNAALVFQRHNRN